MASSYENFRSIVAPRGSPPYWPYTLDYRQPFDCANNKKGSDKKSNSDDGDILDTTIRQNRPRQKRDAKKGIKSYRKKAILSEVKKGKGKRRVRRQSRLGRALRCPSKQYPGLWEIPINPLFNEFNTCHHVDQCVFPTATDSDTDDILEFLVDNFERYYNTNRAPFQLNFHVTWFTSKVHVRALNRFLDLLIRDYKDVWFVTFQQLVAWMKNPQPIGQLNFHCNNRTTFSCNRPHTCQLKHLLDKNNAAATEENVVRTDTR